MDNREYRLIAGGDGLIEAIYEDGKYRLHLGHFEDFEDAAEAIKKHWTDEWIRFDLAGKEK